MHTDHSSIPLLDQIRKQQALIADLSTTHLGILSAAAVRWELNRLTEPCDIIALDFRKLHEWNDVLGYDVANTYFARFVRARMGLDGRRRDIRGQWGGDEIVIVTGVGHGVGLIMRMIDMLDQLTNELSEAERGALRARTGGLFDGFAAVFCLIQRSTCPYVRIPRGDIWIDSGDAARAVTECGKLKAGNVTGERATSGRPGSIIGTLKPERAA